MPSAISSILVSINPSVTLQEWSAYAY